jgi:sugar/nucleoside kinase (ribokinase family)
LLVITRGEKGAVAINGNEVIESAAQKNLKIIDLTGAGDLFAAGFLHGYINKLSTKKCLEKVQKCHLRIIHSANWSKTLRFNLLDLITFFFTKYKLIIIKCI